MVGCLIVVVVAVVKNDDDHDDDDNDAGDSVIVFVVWVVCQTRKTKYMADAGREQRSISPKRD